MKKEIFPGQVEAQKNRWQGSERGKLGQTFVCVCVCASDLGLSTYLKERLCQALSTAGQKASNKRPACSRQYSGTTLAGVGWLKWGR